MRSPCTTTREEPLLTETRESPCSAMKTQGSQKKKKVDFTILAINNQKLLLKILLKHMKYLGEILTKCANPVH